MMEEDRSENLTRKAIVNTLLLTAVVIAGLVLFFLFQGGVERLL